MSQAVTLNSVGYTIPDVGENDWGQNVTDFLVAIPGAVLQKSGGTFTLTAEVDFGVTYGLKSVYFKTRAGNPATGGEVRLGVADTVSWRNNANGANLHLGVDAADALTFGSNKVLTVAGGFTTVATNTFANQKGIRFMEQTVNGVNYIEIVAPDAVTANTTLKLPDGAGTAGQVLSTDGSGVLSWINAAGGGTINSGVQGRLAMYPSNGTTVDDTVTMTNVVTVAIATHGQTSAYTIPDSGAATANFVMSEGAATINGAKTLSGATVISNNSTAAFTISQASSFKVDSTNALVSIGTTTMTYPLYVSKSSAGANVTIAVENTEAANAASHAKLYIVTGGASAGDPFINFYNGVTNISVGMDNSDSDALCWTAASTLNGTNIMRLSSTGALTTASTMTVTAGGLTVTAGGITVSSGVVLMPNGTSTAPAYSFSGETGLGIYRIGAASIGFAFGTVLGASMDFTTGVFDMRGNLVVNLSLGSNTNPSLTFQSDLDTGLYHSAANTLNITTGGTARVSVDTTSLTCNLPLYIQDGTAGAPAFSFGSDTNTGMFNGGADTLNFSTGGTQRIVINTTDVVLTGSVTLNTQSILPNTTNTYNCGTAGAKWLLVRGTTITSGDLRFENDWVMVEGDRVGMPDEGIVIVSPTGKRFRMKLEEIDDKDAGFKKQWADHELDHFERVDPRCDCDGACVHDPAVVREIFKVAA